MGNGAGVLCSPIVELRQYTLHPGQRDTLIDLFDREFVESQEAPGAHSSCDIWTCVSTSGGVASRGGMR